jgi:hypothetical protein
LFFRSGDLLDLFEGQVVHVDATGHSDAIWPLLALAQTLARDDLKIEILFCREHPNQFCALLSLARYLLGIGLFALFAYV